MLKSQESFNQSFLAALHEGRVKPFFQPIIDLRSQQLSGFEVLARWHDPGLGEIDPSLFIHLAERGGLLDELTWVSMRQAFTAAHSWPPHLHLAFNISPSQLHHPMLLDNIVQIAEETGFPLTRVGIEITETAILENLTSARHVLETFCAKGCRIALDDFGTGYSRLSWLRKLPIDTIKIDASFVSDLPGHKQSRKIVTALAGLSQSLGLELVAEGIETVEQAVFLVRAGCSHAQGYLFARPMSKEDVPEYLANPRLPDRVFASGNSPRTSVEQCAAQIRALYRNQNTGIALLDCRLSVLDASQTFAAWLNTSVEEMLGFHIGLLLSPGHEQSERLSAFIVQIPACPPFEYMLPTGKRALMIFTPVTDDTGELTGYCLFGVDIAERIYFS